MYKINWLQPNVYKSCMNFYLSIRGIFFLILLKSIGNDQRGVVANPIINIWLFSDLEYGLRVQSLRTNWQKVSDTWNEK